MVRPFLVGAALMVLAGCSSGEVSLGVQVTPQVATAASALQTNPGTAAQTVSSEAVTLTRVRLLVNEAKLQGADSGGHSGNCPNMGAKAGSDNPLVIDLSPAELQNGAVKQVSLGQVSAGTYTKAELEIEPLEAENASLATTAEFADFKTDNASLIINGTFNGKDFEFRGHFKADQVATGSIDVASAKSALMPLTIDTSTWFKDAQGVALDPTDASLHDQIAKGICTTLDNEAQQPESAMGHDHHGRSHSAPAERCSEHPTAEK